MKACRYGPFGRLLIAVWTGLVLVGAQGIALAAPGPKSPPGPCTAAYARAQHKKPAQWLQEYCTWRNPHPSQVRVPAPKPFAYRLPSAPNKKLPGHWRVRHGVAQPAVSAQANAVSYTPSNILDAYGFTSSDITGSERTVAVVDAYGDPTLSTDLSTFESNFGLPAVPVSVNPVDGGPSGSNSSWAQETALDVEWIAAQAQGSGAVQLEETPDATVQHLLDGVAAAISGGYKIVSMSWGVAETEMTSSYGTCTYNSTTYPSCMAAFEAAFQAGQAAGATFVASSGDNGSLDGQSTNTVQYPASSPEVLSVGGTSLTMNSGGTAWQSETAWSGSGGGYSLEQPEPAYQSGAGIVPPAGSGPSWAQASTLPEPSSSAQMLYDVSCGSSSDCVAVGYYSGTANENEILYSTDAGADWTAASPPQPGNQNILYSVSCASASDCVAVGYDSNKSTGNYENMVLYSTDGGSTWTAASGLPNTGSSFDSYLYWVSCPTTSACVAVGSYGSGGYSYYQALYTTDGGSTWSAASSLAQPATGTPELIGVYCDSSTHCIAVGNYYNGSYTNVVFVSTDGGNSWTAASTVPQPNVSVYGNGVLYQGLFGVYCMSSSDCVAGGEVNNTSDYGQNLIVTSTDGGNTWSMASSVPQPAGSSNNQSVNAIWCPTSSDCTAVGTYTDSSGAGQNMVLNSTNGGSSWTNDTTVPQPFGTSTSTDGNAVWCGAVQSCVVVGGGGSGTVDNEALLESPGVTYGRGVPDVAYDANPSTGVEVYEGGSWLVVGGTSFSAPSWAAIIDDSYITEGQIWPGGSAGSAPGEFYGTVYQTASYYADGFHDITSGSNGGYSAGTGWDPVTGIGTPVVSFLLAPPYTGNTKQFTMPDALVGSSYSQAMAQVLKNAVGQWPFTPPYGWSTSPPPPGLAVSGTGTDSSEGLLSGTATTAGTYTFTLKVADSSAPDPMTDTFSVTVNEVAPLAITTSSLPGGAVGSAYSATLAASGGTTPYTWSVASGSLPAGLTLDAATGTVSGTPSSGGTSTFTVQVQDSGSPAQTASKSFSITISAPLTVTTSSLPSGTVGSGYSATLAASGGTGSGYTWSITSGSLPAGLSLTASTGAISGTPSTSGTSSFTVQVKDSGSNTASKALSITVNTGGGGSGLTITTTSLTGATQESSYSASLAASGGSSPYTWSVILGGLPAGLSLDASTGAISGIPTTTGTYDFTVKVADSGSPQQAVQQALSITVSASSGLTVSGLSPTSGPVGGTVTITGTGLRYVRVVDFGSTAGTGIHYNSGGTILTVVAPPGTGTVTLTLVAVTGKITAGTYTYT